MWITMKNTLNVNHNEENFKCESQQQSLYMWITMKITLKMWITLKITLNVNHNKQ
jgi:hypothetical protein